jgi:glycosyltransferase involved in cell wall biosynthesis
MNILATTPYFYPEGGGLERYAYNIFKGLVKKGYNITVFCATKKGYDYSEEIDGIIVNRLKPDIIISNTPIRLNLFNILNKEISINKYDMINSHTPVPYFAEIAALTAYKHKIDYIVTFHVADNTSPRLWLNAIYKLLDITIEPIMFNIAKMIIAVNELVKQGYLARFSYKTEVIPPGVDTNIYKPIKYNISNKQLLFIAPLSSSYEWKGLRVLLDAMQLVIKNNPDLLLIIVGDGPLKDEYINICKKKGIYKNVIFKGRLTEDELIRCYQESTLLIIPSIAVDSFPLIMLEANACGIPVVASKVGGIPYYIKDGFNGILVEPKNHLMLANKITELLNNEELLMNMSINSRKMALEYDWDIIVDKTMMVLNNLMIRYG